ncbi:MAG: folate-binding protein YgfZ, partial [Thermoleophilia bacterium]|nr:folate-binding protein YgfZ [Thermoleophilia bacterium]
MPDIGQTVDQQVYAALKTRAVVARPPTATGVLELTGDDAAEFLQGQVTNDIQALAAGKGAYAALLSPKGQMRADMRVLNTGVSLLLLAEANLMPVIRKTIDTFRVGYRFKTDDRGDRLELISLAGPRAHELLAAALGDTAVPGAAENDNAAAGDGLLAITTLLGVDLLGPRDALAPAERALIEAGAEPAGAAALELARIERGVPRYGAEIGDQTIPEEAGLNDRAVSFTKGCYVGQETVARLHYKGKPNRRLRGLALAGVVVPGTPVTAADGRELGNIGSVAVS